MMSRKNSDRARRQRDRRWRKNMKIYISGPITGTEGYRARFDAAERRLKKEGHKVVNPARVNAALPEGTTHKEYMSVSIAMLDMCEIIFMLKGWEKSIGCSQELAHAMANGMTIVFEGGKH